MPNSENNNCISKTSTWEKTPSTGILVLSDGTSIKATGIGAEGAAAGEICFNTSITGYQEIITDPSYAGQIITFTSPHIGNIGTNSEDSESSGHIENPNLKGVILRNMPTSPANYRAEENLSYWLKSKNIIGIYGVDTRAITTLIREKGAINAIISHSSEGKFDIDHLQQMINNWEGIKNSDLASKVTCKEPYNWDNTSWQWPNGYGIAKAKEYTVVAIDFGIKSNILNLLSEHGCRVITVPARTTAEEILAYNPDGIFLSNGPGDPAATGKIVITEIRKLIETRKPIFGICLGHQILALALGGNTKKMPNGHHGANHPVKNKLNNTVEIVSMNHGFEVDMTTLPNNVIETHKSLFDGSNCGISVKDRPIFSVQHHPEASPGPQDSYYLFTQFTSYMDQAKKL